MVEERSANFEGYGHAGAIHFREDVVRQVRFDVHILDFRKEIIGVGTVVVITEDIESVVLAESLLKFGSKKPQLFIRPKIGNRIKITF
jgi:hypothetical protein